MEASLEQGPPADGGTTAIPMTAPAGAPADAPSFVRDPDAPPAVAMPSQARAARSDAASDGVARQYAPGAAPKRTSAPLKPLSAGEAAVQLERMMSATPPGLQEETLSIPRLATKLGLEDFQIRIRELDDNTLKQIESRSQRPTTEMEQRGGYGRIRQDAAYYNMLICAAAIVDPDMVALSQQPDQGPRPEDVVGRWFNQGERALIANIALELMGFEQNAVVRLGKES